ncbi:unnamed protein product [Peronospora belbahrii]|uniref:Uncharacterized protein n=1 Tax=Peronospora belbahrii TaxID=622444 RepID=A0AAU9L177_9STRA|nr:unnamed protein product [Peronospora belbahrii]
MLKVIHAEFSHEKEYRWGACLGLRCWFGLLVDGSMVLIDIIVANGVVQIITRKDDMQILLQGRRRMHVCAGLPGMKSGTIYECNVEPDEEDNLRVVRAIPRTDEVRPNSRSVLSTVLALLRSTDDVDYTLIDRVSSYSFRVREYIYRRMENMGVKSGFTGLELVDKRYGSRFLNPWLLYSRSWREEGLSVHITEEAPNPYSLLTRLSSSFVSVATPSCTPSHFLIWWKRLIGWLLPGSNRLDVATFMTGSVEDGVLIDLGGISMKMHPDKPGYAVAKYGSKVEYVEPAVRTRDFRATKMSYATDVIYGDCEIEEEEDGGAAGTEADLVLPCLTKTGLADAVEELADTLDDTGLRLDLDITALPEEPRRLTGQIGNSASLHRYEEWP